jgi:hypothetical protein
MVTRRCAARVLDRAFTAEREGRFQEAFQMAEGVLETLPQNRDALLLRARHWARTGLIECARAELTQLLARDPDFLEAHMALSGVMLLCGEYSPAIEHLRLVAQRCEESGHEDEMALREEVALEAHQRMETLWSSYQEPRAPRPQSRFKRFTREEGKE